MRSEADDELDLVAEVVRFTHDPLGYAQWAWDWDAPGSILEGIPGPRAWQCDTLGIITNHLQDPATRHQPCLIAVASGHGIGKSALIGMVINWAMSTCEDCRVVVTANTDRQLTNKTWPEVTKWLSLSVTADWFTSSATSVYSKEPGHDRSWRADAVPWSTNNTEAFAGLHNLRKRIVIVMDEASAIDDKIWEVVEGALTDQDTEIIWIVFGNPTRASGRFRECFRRYAKRWHHRQIDSRTVEGVNLQAIQKLIESTDGGEDSDVVKVRVRGLFPNLSYRQFIGERDVDAAFGKHLRRDQYEFAPKIIGVDPAWTGDDSLEIFMRQGLASWHLLTIPRNDDDVAVANVIARLEDEHGADAVFVDLGYGTGIVSVGRAMGRTWLLVPFGGKSTDPSIVNKRAEMWRDMRDWLKEGAAIPPDPELRDDLTAVETVPRVDGKLLLESKEDMKERGLKSPNKGDALAITFAYPVAPRERREATRVSRGTGQKSRA